MKTIKFLALAALILIFTSGNSYAKTRQQKNISPVTWYFWCDGVSDIIEGYWTIHDVMHFDENGQLVKINVQRIGHQLKSISGEVFTLVNILKEDIVQSGTFYEVSIHYNLIGNRGSHYMVREIFQIDFSTDPVTFTQVRYDYKCW